MRTIGRFASIWFNGRELFARLSVSLLQLSQLNFSSRRTSMNKFIVAVAALLVSSACFAQAGTAIKEGAKATAETTKQAKENVEAAVTKEPKKSMHKAKAKVHKEKAHEDATEAKDAVKAIGK
jgi:high-affinity K+ transport system ATPase subunit B